ARRHHAGQPAATGNSAGAPGLAGGTAGVSPRRGGQRADAQGEQQQRGAPKRDGVPAAAGAGHLHRAGGPVSAERPARGRERNVVYSSAGVPPSPSFASSDQLPPGEAAEGWLAYLVGVEERNLLMVAGSLITGEARIMALTPDA